MWQIFVSYPLTLAVNFHCRTMYKICGEKKQLFTAYITFFAIFPRPGSTINSYVTYILVVLLRKTL